MYTSKSQGSNKGEGGRNLYCLNSFGEFGNIQHVLLSGENKYV
jgi:hypothetical protein